MTAPDPRLDEIQDKYGSDQCKRHDDCMRSDMAYLLAELRKAHEALEQVDLALDAMDAGVAIRSGDPRTKSYTATLIRAAVAAANGEERG